jgi:hypothetical protein
MEPALGGWDNFYVIVGSSSGALTLRTSVPASADMVALAALGLLFIGIHNAWDTVTYIVVSRPRDEE